MWNGRLRWLNHFLKRWSKQGTRLACQCTHKVHSYLLISCSTSDHFTLHDILLLLHVYSRRYIFRCIQRMSRPSRMQFCPTGLKGPSEKAPRNAAKPDLCTGRHTREAPERSHAYRARVAVHRLFALPFRVILRRTVARDRRIN